jgi:hypothetical protein
MQINSNPLDQGCFSWFLLLGVADHVAKAQKLSGINNNPECSIYSWFSGNNFGFLKVPECSFSGNFLGLITH